MMHRLKHAMMAGVAGIRLTLMIVIQGTAARHIRVSDSDSLTCYGQFE